MTKAKKTVKKAVKKVDCIKTLKARVAELESIVENDIDLMRIMSDAGIAGELELMETKASLNAVKMQIKVACNVLNDTECKLGIILISEVETDNVEVSDKGDMMTIEHASVVGRQLKNVLAGMEEAKSRMGR